jgi:hypothetical protein
MKFSKKMIDDEIRQFKNMTGNGASNTSSNVFRGDKRFTSSTVFADRAGYLFSSPAQTDDCFIKMGVQVEDVVTSSFMVSIDFADQITKNYGHSAQYLLHQKNYTSRQSGRPPSCLVSLNLTSTSLTLKFTNIYL